MKNFISVSIFIVFTTNWLCMQFCRILQILAVCFLFHSFRFIFRDNVQPKPTIDLKDNASSAGTRSTMPPLQAALAREPARSSLRPRPKFENKYGSCEKRRR